MIVSQESFDIKKGRQVLPAKRPIVCKFHLFALKTKLCIQRFPVKTFFLIKLDDILTLRFVLTIEVFHTAALTKNNINC